MSSETLAQATYRLRSKPLETPEFVAWFETWYGEESDYDGHPELRDAYLNERNFALCGWIASRTPGAETMSCDEFVKMALVPPGMSLEDINDEINRLFPIGTQDKM